MIAYSYDPGGRRTSMSYAAGMTTYAYDRDNHLVLLTNPWNELTHYARDLAEPLTTITLANGSIVSHRYDDADRLVYRGDPGIRRESVDSKFWFSPDGSLLGRAQGDFSVYRVPCVNGHDKLAPRQTVWRPHAIA